MRSTITLTSKVLFGVWHLPISAMPPMRMQLLLLLMGLTFRGVNYVLNTKRFFKQVKRSVSRGRKLSAECVQCSSRKSKAMLISSTKIMEQSSLRLSPLNVRFLQVQPINHSHNTHRLAFLPCQLPLILCLLHQSQRLLNLPSLPRRVSRKNLLPTSWTWMIHLLWKFTPEFYFSRMIEWETNWHSPAPFRPSRGG